MNKHQKTGLTLICGGVLAVIGMFVMIMLRWSDPSGIGYVPMGLSIGIMTALYTCAAVGFAFGGHTLATAPRTIELEPQDY